MKSEIEINFDKLNEYIITYFQNNDESLNEAKELFSPFIQSNRQLENVKNIQQLLSLLKRRGLYSAMDFNTFWMFKKIIEDEAFLALVMRHKKLIQSYQGPGEPTRNTYGIRRNNEQLSSDRPSSSTSRNSNHTFIPPNTIPTSNVESVRNEIFNIIADGISLAEFRRLARHLGFTKEEIKDIELNCHEFRTQNLVLLRKYESRGCSLTILLKVLNLIEKPDLVKVITEILKRFQR